MDGTEPPVRDDNEWGEAARALFNALTRNKTVPPITKVLITEACRMVERLERMDKQLNGRPMFYRRAKEETEGDYILHVDRALSEARETATALRGVLQDVAKQLSEANEEQDETPSAVSDLMTRIAARRAAAK